MFGIRDLLNIARSGLFAQQAGLNTTGHNIANATTEGYSRQRAELGTSQPALWGPSAMGAGVDVIGVKRIRDQYIDAQLRAQDQSLGWWETMETKLSQLEDAFGEPSDTGLGAAINAFFDSWQDLANAPDNMVARDAVLSKGRTLALKFNYLNDKLTDLQRSLDSEVSGQVDEFNSLTKQLAQLNGRLSTFGANAQGAADLLDQRDRLLDRLSHLANVQVVENDAGQVMLSLDGKVFLEKTNATELRGTRSDTSLTQLSWSDADRLVTINNGSLGALMDLRDNVIGKYSTKLDELAVDIANGVNEVHATGYGLNGHTGLSFFASTVTGAADMRIDSQIAADSRKIAASSNAQQGNGDIALAISQLQQENKAANSTMTFANFYGGMIGEIGSLMQEATSFSQGQSLMVQQLENQRESEMGVSLDEEMTNLIKYQRAYQATAKLVSMADEMAQTILNMV